MPNPNVDPSDIVARLLALERKVAQLAQRGKTRKFASVNRPDPAKVTGMVIFNLTTKKHEGSDGTTWQPLY